MDDGSGTTEMLTIRADPLKPMPPVYVTGGTYGGGVSKVYFQKLV